MDVFEIELQLLDQTLCGEQVALEGSDILLFDVEILEV
jgi:hypothetical protein